MGQPVAVGSNPPTLGAIERSDWEASPIPLTRGSSIVAQLHARNIPATRDVLAAIAQANGITDFRHILEGTLIWLPRRESLMGERASFWREAYRGITPDSFNVVDRDRQAGRSVLGRQAARPLIATPPARNAGPRPAGDAGPDGLTPLPGVPQSAIPAPVASAETQAASEPTDDGPASAPGATQDPAVAPTRQATADPAQAARRAPPQPPEQRLQATATELVKQLRHTHSREAILAITFDLMSNPNWTNAAARQAYAVAAGSNDQWQIIRDLRASGLSDRDTLRASEYVWNDESTPYRGQVSPPIRAALAAVGFTTRVGLDAGVGTADATMEDALWDIVDGMGVEQANAILASRAGPTPGGVISNLRFNVDPDHMGLWAGIMSRVVPSRAPAPVDGHVTAPAPGTNALETLIRTEKNPMLNVMGGFSSAERERWLAILRMPQGTDRQAFETAAKAVDARGEDFLKLFEGKTLSEMEQISTAFAVGFGAKNHGGLANHAQAVLSSDEYMRFSALLQGTRSNPSAASAYIARTLRAHDGDAKLIREVLTRNLGNAGSNGPRWPDVVDADAQINPQQAQRKPLSAVLGDLARDPMLQVVTRDNANPDEPTGLARRVLASHDAKEITAILKRKNGELFNEQELAVMNQTAAQLTGTDPAAIPSALYQHVMAECGEKSEAALIVQRVGGAPVDVLLYDSVGRLAPSVQLYFALQRRDNDAVTTILASTSFADLGTLQQSYGAIAAYLATPQALPPGNTGDPRAAISAVLRGEERTRALQFLTGVDVASLETANATGSALAKRVSDDLGSRCAWLLGLLDHEREPLRERLMQFQVTLRQVLTDVDARRAAAGQSVELTDAEQVRLGEAVARLISQQRAFGSERDQIATSIQNTSIIVATMVASAVLTVGTVGAGAPAGAALMVTAGNIARVAAAGALAGVATAPLQAGGIEKYGTGALKGGAYGAFVGLAASGAVANQALARVMPGQGLMMTMARAATVNGVAWGGLYSSFNIGVEFESTDEMLHKVGRDVMRGFLWGAGVGAMMGLSQWLNAYANGEAGAAAAATAPAGSANPSALTENLSAYARARDLSSMQQAFARMSGGSFVPGSQIVLDDAGRALFAQGLSRHLQALARAPVHTAVEVAEQARWMATLTLYADAAGVQLQGAALQNAMMVLRQIGYPGVPAQLTEENARALMSQMAQKFVDRTLELNPPGIATAGGPAPKGGASANPSPGPKGPSGPTAERGIRLRHVATNQKTNFRSWNAVSARARAAGTRATSLEEAVHAREELTAMQNMINTPHGRESIVAMRTQLGNISARDLAGIRRSYTAAIARVDKQIADSIRSEAQTLASRPVPVADPSQLYQRLARLSDMKNLLGTMRGNGATLEVVESASPAVQASSAALDANLAARFRESVPGMGKNSAEVLKAVRQYRDFLHASGFDRMAPKTASAVETTLRRLSQAGRRAA